MAPWCHGMQERERTCPLVTGAPHPACIFWGESLAESVRTQTLMLRPPKLSLEPETLWGLFPIRLLGRLLSLQESDHDPVLSPIDIETADGNTACPLCHVMVSHGFHHVSSSVCTKLGAGSLSFFPQPFFPHGKNWGRDGKTSPC